MDQCETIMKIILAAVKSTSDNNIDSEQIPVGVFNRHVHLMTEDLEKLYGAGYELTKFKELSQPGQFVCKETVDVCGPNGTIEKVRILGPMLMYGKEASNRKQEIDRQHYTIPNQRPKDKHCGKI